jgi:hypothetical protein
MNVSSGACSAGYYCTLNSTVSAPAAGSGVGGVCPIGSFCPARSAAPTPCTGGYYCPSAGLSAPFAQCAAGYFCASGANSSTPADGRCPAGAWCGVGSQAPTPCLTGTFAASRGNTQASNCIPCTGGYECSTSGLTAPSALCPATYYCPNGTASATLQCGAGTFCPLGSSAPVPCAAGFYTAAAAQAVCTPCPARTYCLGTGNTNPTVCPAGYYCPTNTSFFTAFPCPVVSLSFPLSPFVWLPVRCHSLRWRVCGVASVAGHVFECEWFGKCERVQCMHARQLLLEPGADGARGPVQRRLVLHRRRALRHALCGRRQRRVSGWTLLPEGKPPDSRDYLLVHARS